MATGIERVRALVLEIGSELSPGDVQATMQGFQRLKQGLDGVKRVARRSFAVVGAAIAALIGKLIYAANETARYAQQITLLSEETGIATEELQGWLYAAQQVNVGIPAFTAAMRQFSVAVVGIGNTASRAGEAFQDLGVEARTADGRLRPLTALLSDVADAISEIDRDDPRAMDLATRIFGEQGAALLPLLRRGAAGIKDLREEAERLGIVLDKDALEAANKYNEAVGRLQTRMRGLTYQIGSAIIPAFTALLDRVEGWYDRNAQEISRTLEDGIRQIGHTVERVARLFLDLDEIIRTRFGRGNAIKLAGVALVLWQLGSALVSATSALWGFATAGGTVVAAITGIGAAAATGIVGLVALAAVIGTAGLIANIVALGLAVDDLNAYLRGAPSVLGDVIAKYRQMGPAGQLVADMLVLMARYFGTLRDRAREAVRSLWLMAGLLETGLRTTLLNTRDAVVDLIDAINRLTGLKIGPDVMNLVRRVGRGIVRESEMRAEGQRRRNDALEGFLDRANDEDAYRFDLTRILMLGPRMGPGGQVTVGPTNISVDARGRDPSGIAEETGAAVDGRLRTAAAAMGGVP